MKSWKTTVSGIVVLGAGIYLLSKGENVQGGVCITIGLGLLSAKDGDVTGGSRVQE